MPWLFAGLFTVSSGRERRGRSINGRSKTRERRRNCSNRQPSPTRASRAVLEMVRFHEGQTAAVEYEADVDLKETGDLGFEPRLTDPESVVLPLHQSPVSLSFPRGCDSLSLSQLQLRPGNQDRRRETEEKGGNSPEQAAPEHSNRLYKSLPCPKTILTYRLWLTSPPSRRRIFLCLRRPCLGRLCASGVSSLFAVRRRLAVSVTLLFSSSSRQRGCDGRWCRRRRVCRRHS